MEIREITNKEEWEGFLSQCVYKTFLHSWSWGEFNKDTGSKIWRFGVYESERIIGVFLVYKISARRGTFLFIPHGPVVSDSLNTKDKRDVLQAILEELRVIAKEENASFVRVSSVFERTTENENIFFELGFRQSPIHMHPEVTWELDITPSEEEILMNMRKTTRYLIRQAEKDPDIEIIKSSNINDLNQFFPVYQETAKRHHFVIFSQNYIETELKSFLPDSEVLIFLGKYQREVVSVAIFVFWQKGCYYHHSGSLSKYNKIPVSYLLQWEAIKEAKARGCNLYNFWGIAPDIKEKEDIKKSKHPWAGLSLFKIGFGGYRKDYVKTKDFIISGKYWLNYTIEKIRKHKRGL